MVGMQRNLGPNQSPREVKDPQSQIIKAPPLLFFLLRVTDISW